MPLSPTPPPDNARPRRRIWRRLLVVTLIFLILGCPASYFGYEWYARHDAIRVTCKWARIAPLPVPESAADVRILGSIFTREFRVSFTSDAATIAKWQSASPGLTGTPLQQTGSIRKFSIKPGGGAQFAEVTIDDATGRVIIRTYWS